MSIHQSSSAGVLGWFVRRLAKEGLVSLMFANSSKAVAAHGGKVPFFGTNPFAFGAPRAGDEPLVVDMATASTAASIWSKRQPKGGESNRVMPLIPREANDRSCRRFEGRPVARRAPKGFGLGLMVDVLGGVLTGSNCSYEASMFATTEGDHLMSVRRLSQWIPPSSARGSSNTLSLCSVT